MINIGINIPFILRNYTSGVTPPPLLDYLPYTTNLSSAWSSQRVVVSGYVGSLIRLRRSSDNSESDFGYLVGDGLIDNASIVTWLGGATGYYVKIYDQNGSNHYIQNTTTLQPERYNNRPYSNDNKMMVMTNTYSTENYTMIDVSEGVGNTNRVPVSDTTSNPPYFGLMYSFLPNSYNRQYYYFGDGNTSGRYYIQYVNDPLNHIVLAHGLGGDKDTNIIGYNGIKIRDTVPTVASSPTGWYKDVNASWFNKAAGYTIYFKGYLDERYLFSQLLNDTNLGTVETYINDKYAVY